MGKNVKRQSISRWLAILTMITLAVVTNAQGDEFEAVDVPDNIAEKVEGLDQEKIDFLRGDEIFSFAGSHESEIPESADRRTRAR